jgi:glycine cleavage system H protein
MNFPKNLKYTETHEWIDLAGTKATVGVSAYAIEHLGDIVHIEMPSVGDKFGAGESFGSIESTKAVSDMYLPVAGKVVEVNEDLASSPEKIQKDAYQDGWLVKIELSGTPDTSKLKDAAAYTKFCEEQAH